MSGNVLFVGTYDKMLSSRAHTQCSKVEDWVLFICTTMEDLKSSRASSIELFISPTLKAIAKCFTLPIPTAIEFLRVETSPWAIHDGTYQIAGNISAHTHYARTPEKREEKNRYRMETVLVQFNFASPEALQSKVRGFYNVIWGRFLWALVFVSH